VLARVPQADGGVVEQGRQLGGDLRAVQLEGRRLDRGFQHLDARRAQLDAEWRLRRGDQLALDAHDRLGRQRGEQLGLLGRVQDDLRQPLAVAAIGALTFLNDAGRSLLLPSAVMLVAAALGAYDDRLSLVGSRGGGLSARAKFALLSGACAIAAFILWSPGALGIDYLLIPGVIGRVHLGWLIIPVAWFAPVGFANAVNLTDGLDGLAGHTAAVSFAAYGTIAFLQGQVYLVAFCFMVAGALLAFLWLNAYPAQVIMGDTGALALGATLAVVALMLGQVLLLPIIGLVYVAVTVSVIAQVGYFRLSAGKRLLRRAPLHRHFELIGWSQMQVAQRFWLISMVTGLLGVALALA
jgi:phospho-N-acetylmuramoyl-pentapeptide-transferase